MMSKIYQTKFKIFIENQAAAKGLPASYDIIIAATRHVETVVLLSHKNADTHINVNVEFGDGDGKIHVGKIAEKAEDYRPRKSTL